MRPASCNKLRQCKRQRLKILGEGFKGNGAYKQNAGNTASGDCGHHKSPKEKGMRIASPFAADNAKACSARLKPMVTPGSASRAAC